MPEGTQKSMVARQKDGGAAQPSLVGGTLHYYYCFTAPLIPSLLSFTAQQIHHFHTHKHLQEKFTVYVEFKIFLTISWKFWTANKLLISGSKPIPKWNLDSVPIFRWEPHTAEYSRNNRYSLLLNGWDGPNLHQVKPHCARAHTAKCAAGTSGELKTSTDDRWLNMETGSVSD